MLHQDGAQSLAVRPASVVQFLSAITKDTVAALSGVVSIALLFLGLWLPPNSYKDAVFILAGLSVLWATYRVWGDERNRITSLSSDYRQLQQCAGKASDELNEAEGKNANYLANIESLKIEIARLSVRPFDDQQKAHASSLIAQFNYMQRDLLRLLLLKGGTVRGDVIFLARTSPAGGLDLNGLSKTVIEKGLVTRTDDHLTGYATFQLNQSMEDVLKELLFPRKGKEGNDTPFFNGV